jgi:DNA primase
MTPGEVEAHLRERGMVHTFNSVAFDEDVATFYLRDFSGRQVGYQRYRPFAERNCRNVKEARYFTRLPRGVNGYWGLESLMWDGTVYLVEGVFKAAKLHNLHVPAVALMGSETKHHITQLLLMGRRFVGVGDNDPAGEKFARALGGFTSPRDLDEMTDEEVEKLL